MTLSFKNRIAFHYMIATAIIMSITFGAIYFMVQNTVMRHLDDDLNFEAKKHTGEIKINGDTIVFKNKAEWEEKEHLEIQVNPVFIQLMNKKGVLMDKSPNLKEDSLLFKSSIYGGHFDTFFQDRAIRQVQFPIEINGNIEGYILAAISSESSQSVILKLRNILILSYLVILSGLYFISRYLAGRSIKPIKNVTKTIKQITKHNLKERVALPQHKDEVYKLSAGFNALLERIEKTIEREKQFTSDASHELRTPLSTLRGTLEVLVRKPRTKQEYEEKIKFSLHEIDRMALTIDQLLLLARIASEESSKKENLIFLPAIIDETLIHFSPQLKEKELSVNFQFSHDHGFLVPHYYTHLIINNVLSNAIKYAHIGTELTIRVLEKDNHVVCSIQDQGIGIKEEDLEHVFESFYRSDALDHKQIQGNGLGLSIVKKCAEAIDAKIDFKSELSAGTIVTITF